MSEELREEENTITLVDEEGNEILFEIILTIDGEEKFGKQYMLVVPAGLPEDEELEVLAYSYVESEDGEGGDLEPVTTDEEWDMIEETFETMIALEEEE